MKDLLSNFLIRSGVRVRWCVMICVWICLKLFIVMGEVFSKVVR